MVKQQRSVLHNISDMPRMIIGVSHENSSAEKVYGRSFYISIENFTSIV